MMRIFFTTAILSIILWFIGTSFVSAQGLVPCDGLNCNADSIGELINNIVWWLLSISWVLAAVGFAIAGFFILTSGGNQGRLETGKKMFWGVLWGLLLILTAYLIVDSIVTVLSGGTIG